MTLRKIWRVGRCSAQPAAGLARAPLALILILVAGLILAAAPNFEAGATRQNASDQAPAEKKTDSKSDKQPDQVAPEFSEQATRAALGDLRDGLEGHSLKLMLRAFDGDRMPDYPRFARNLQAFFDSYEMFRMHFKILQSSGQGPRGAVLLDFELEETPVAGGPVVRKSRQVRFEMQYGQKGWRIVDFQPRGFFS